MSASGQRKRIPSRHARVRRQSRLEKTELQRGRSVCASPALATSACNAQCSVRPRTQPIHCGSDAANVNRIRKKSRVSSASRESGRGSGGAIRVRRRQEGGVARAVERERGRNKRLSLSHRLLAACFLNAARKYTDRVMRGYSQPSAALPRKLTGARESERRFCAGSVAVWPRARLRAASRAPRATRASATLCTCRARALCLACRRVAHISTPSPCALFPRLSFFPKPLPAPFEIAGEEDVAVSTARRRD